MRAKAIYPIDFRDREYRFEVRNFRLIYQFELVRVCEMLCRKQYILQEARLELVLLMQHQEYLMYS